MMTLIYLACPYSHKDKKVRAERFKAANRAAVDLMKRGFLVFSPISHSHPIATEGKLKGDWTTWQDFDTRMIYACDEVYVVCVEGWDESEGVRYELQVAHSLRKQVNYYVPPRRDSSNGS